MALLLIEYIVPLVFAVVPIFLFKIFFYSRTKNSPPDLPLMLTCQIASTALKGNLQEVLKGHSEIQKNFGNIVGIPLIRYIVKPSVWIFDYKLVKEAFKSSACFARPYHGFNFYYYDDKVRGLGLHDNEIKWSEIRHFTFRKLKEHGMGKNTFDAISADEASLLIESISQNNVGQPVSTDEIFSISMMNVLWRVISGRRFDFEDDEARTVYSIFSGYFSADDKKVIAFLGLLAILGNISTKLLWWVRYVKSLQVIRHFFIQYKDSSMANYREGEVNNFTDSFIEKIHRTSNPNSMFFGQTGEENLAATVGELLAVGAKSSSVTLQWIMLYLAAHPEKQDLLQKEIDIVLGGRVPTFDDKKSMPYTNAVIQETMRITPLFPAGVPHVTSEDYNLGGYTISKGTVMVSMTVAIQNDPEIWGDPQVFRPERFLTADGCRNISHETFFPFGVGKRACPGKHLAKHNLFIFVTSIFQRFSISVGNTSGKLDLNPKQISSTLAPKPQKLVFITRSIPE